MLCDNIGKHCAKTYHDNIHSRSPTISQAYKTYLPVQNCNFVIGRKKAILLTDLIFILGAVILLFAHHIFTVLVGRVVVGVAVSLSGIADVSYLHEVSLNISIQPIPFPFFIHCTPILIMIPYPLYI